MYLVLFPEENHMSLRTNKEKPKEYGSFCTDSIELVNDAFRKRPGVKAYRLDALKEIKDVIPTYQEVTEETTDE